MRRRATPLDPRAYPKILGSTFGKSEHLPVITIGNRAWSKWDLGRIGCPHPAAAARVARALTQLGITTREEFLDRAHELGRLRTIGVTCYWTVLALARELGADVERTHGAERSFHAIHTQALKTDEITTTRRRTRRRLRR